MRKSSNRKVRDKWGCITSRTPINTQKNLALGLHYMSALDALISGQGNSDHTHVLLSAILLSDNITQAGAEIRVIAKEALFAINERGKLTGKWDLQIAAHKKQSLIAAIAAHDLLMSTVTQSQLKKALEKTLKQVRVL